MVFTVSQKKDFGALFAVVEVLEDGRWYWVGGICLREELIDCDRTGDAVCGGGNIQV